MTRSALAFAVAAALAAPAHAVRLDPDGVGQALIFPYYTTQGSATSVFNTYLSVVNHSSQAKALRVRFRESRSGAEVAAFNLYLDRNDVWVGAVVPQTLGARVISTDTSCTEPAFETIFGGVPPPGDLPGITFRNAQYSGSFDDGGGTGLDRTREGWVEVLEMATLTGSSAAHAAHNSAGTPANCVRLREEPIPNVAAPSGGLSGTLTLIHVQRGFDFTVKAEALADLSTLPYFRHITDPYPDFDAGEISTVSVAENAGTIYRSEWRNPREAVAAALLRSEAYGELVLDRGTRSATDIVATFPTRFRGASSVATPPFTTNANWAADCGTGTGGTPRGEPLTLNVYNRSTRNNPVPGIDPPQATPRICASATVMPLGVPSAQPGGGVGVASLLSSVSRGLSSGEVNVSSSVENGWVRMELVPSVGVPPRMTSLANSTRYVIATGALLQGAHVYSGLPVVGLMARSFENGTLNCGAGSCQGNYGGAFSLSFQRSITP